VGYERAVLVAMAIRGARKRAPAFPHGAQVADQLALLSVMESAFPEMSAAVVPKPSLHWANFLGFPWAPFNPNWKRAKNPGRRNAPPSALGD